MQREVVCQADVRTIAGLGIGQIDDAVKDKLEATFGSPFLAIPPSPHELEDRMQKSKEYLHGEERLKWHRRMGIVLTGIGLPVAGLTAAWLRMFSREEIVRKHQIQMFGGRVETVPKLRTMVKGAHHIQDGPFKHTTFVSHRRRDCDDTRLLPVPLIRLIRKVGADEMLSTWLVLKGKMDVTGVRHFTPEELEGVRLLSLLTPAQFEEANIGGELQWVYRNYPTIMSNIRPRHAGIAVKESFGNGRTDFWQLKHHGVRQLTDILFVLNATREVEEKMIDGFWRARQLKAVKQTIGHVLGT